jgi:NAD-dependent DNA ligase
VVSGVFENISRDKVETFILDHGGRRTGSVSGKTDYLVVGYKMEDGREVTQGGKYNGAKKKGIEILNEEKFEELI